MDGDLNELTEELDGLEAEDGGEGEETGGEEAKGAGEPGEDAGEQDKGEGEGEGEDGGEGEEGKDSPEDAAFLTFAEANPEEAKAYLAWKEEQAAKEVEEKGAEDKAKDQAGDILTPEEKARAEAADLRGLSHQAQAQFERMRDDYRDLHAEYKGLSEDLAKMTESGETDTPAYVRLVREQERLSQTLATRYDVLRNTSEALKALDRISANCADFPSLGRHAKTYAALVAQNRISLNESIESQIGKVIQHLKASGKLAGPAPKQQDAKAMLERAKALKLKIGGSKGGQAAVKKAGGKSQAGGAAGKKFNDAYLDQPW